MIYFLAENLMPKSDELMYEHIIYDLNGFQWRLVEITTGFIVQYQGDKYFKPDTFCITFEKENQIIKVKNTCCIFFKDATHETYFNVRTFLKDNWTDDIWESFEKLLTARLMSNPELLESEI